MQPDSPLQAPTAGLPVRRTRSAVPRLAFALCLFAAGIFLWGSGRSELGDLSSHYTDHLRHEGESLALLKYGFAIYQRPYGELVKGVGLTDGRHDDLWQNQTAPYPPLGILYFAPVALLERAGRISPAHAHAACVGLLVLVGLLACLAGWAVARRSNRGFRVAFVAIACSLLYGAAANGFFDVLFCLAGFLGLAAYADGEDARATAFFALAGCLHFRAMVFAPVALASAWRGLREHRGRMIAVLAVASVALAPVAYAAVILDTHGFEVANPLRLKLARAVAFFAVDALAIAYAAFRRRPITALTLAAASFLMFADASHCWWHALVLIVPPLVAVAEDSRLGTPGIGAWLWLWTLAVSFTAYRDPWPPFWEWIRWFLHRFGWA